MKQTNMRIKLFFALLIAILLLPGCSNAPTANTKQAPQTTAPPVATTPDTPARKRPTAGKLNIDLSEEAAKPGGQPNPAAVQAPKPAYKPPPPPEGPSGYVSRKNVVLQNNPSVTSPTTGHFKLYEEVTILETLSKDDQGYDTEVPTWYKVRCKDRKVGWVVARSVTVN